MPDKTGPIYGESDIFKIVSRIPSASTDHESVVVIGVGGINK